MTSELNTVGSDIWTHLRKGGYSLQINLDVNGVVLGQETIGDVLTPPEEYAATMLANGTYTEWKPGLGAKSYKMHVWDELHPGANSDQGLRKMRKEALRQFVPTLETSKHPLCEIVKAQYQKLVPLLQQSPIFPSFPYLVQTLSKSDIPHHFLFRTFGGDGDYIQAYLAKNFPHIALQSGKFDEEGHFHYDKEGSEIVVQDPNEVRELLKGRHWIVQENFKRWNGHQEKGNFGKLFTFSSDLEDRVISVFADDNLEIVPDGEQKTIVCCYDSVHKTRVSTQQALAHLIKVNPIEAALDQHYLTNQILVKAEGLLAAHHIA